MRPNLCGQNRAIPAPLALPRDNGNGASQPQEVRASAFTLVAPDGTVLASLQRSGAGNANLGLNDGTGTRRVSLGGSGNLNVYDQDGTELVFRAGRTYEGGTTNNPELNGVQLGPDGSIGTLP